MINFLYISFLPRLILIKLKVFYHLTIRFERMLNGWVRIKGVKKIQEIKNIIRDYFLIDF